MGSDAASGVVGIARVRDRVLKWGAAAVAAGVLVGAAWVALRATRGGESGPPSGTDGETTTGGDAVVRPGDAAPVGTDAGRGASTSLASAPGSEAALMTRLRAAVDADPPAALALADEGDRRFPDGTLADERAFLRMRALVHLNRIVDARVRARELYARSPDSPWSARAFQLTGEHPRPTPLR